MAPQIPGTVPSVGPLAPSLVVPSPGTAIPPALLPPNFPNLAAGCPGCCVTSIVAMVAMVNATAQSAVTAIASMAHRRKV
jgi:hypothetical protein